MRMMVYDLKDAIGEKEGSTNARVHAYICVLYV